MLVRLRKRNTKQSVLANKIFKNLKKTLDKRLLVCYNKYIPKKKGTKTMGKKIVVFDTETTSIEKPFVYNIGYKIIDTETNTCLVKHDFVVEQVWHNKELFTTSYYADKRQEYINRMRAKTCIMAKIGYITQTMCREFKFYQVESAYAYNSSFDDGVFEFNCEWFKVINPFDNIQIFDIRGYIFKTIAFTNEYKYFCDTHKLYTEKGNYSTTAESVYRFITNTPDFVEEHMALADSEIESEILLYCIKRGCEYDQNYKLYRSVPKFANNVLRIKDTNGNIHEFEYNSLTDYKVKNNVKRIILKKR